MHDFDMTISHFDVTISHSFLLFLLTPKPGKSNISRE
jgi:hypothetical protein